MECICTGFLRLENFFISILKNLHTFFTTFELFRKYDFKHCNSRLYSSTTIIPYFKLE